MNNRTVSKSCHWEGTGLHSGSSCSVTVNSAEVGHGIKFVRTDIDDSPLIKSDLKNVKGTVRNTILGAKDITVGTVEHILSALYALGISNALIEVDGPEIPILDGSSSLFYQGLSQVVQDQEGEQISYSLTETLHYKDEATGAEYIAIPDNEFSVESIIQYDCAVGNCHAIYNQSTDYGDHISPSRTYVLTEEVIELAQNGLIKGGNIDNAIVIESKEYKQVDFRNALNLLKLSNIDSIIDSINDGPQLKFDNELSRHKILDFIGDLSLLGIRIKAKFIIRKPGHTHNVAFANMLKELYGAHKKKIGIPIYNANEEPIFDTEKVKSYLPHRYPFLMVDKIIELSDQQVVGVKNITFNENFFMGHFPGNPIFPGVLQMEALAQTGGILALNQVDNPSDWDTYFLKMDNVKFKRKVVPGDTLILKMELLAPIRRGIVQMKGTTYVGDQIASQGELTAQIVDRTKV